MRPAITRKESERERPHYIPPCCSFDPGHRALRSDQHGPGGHAARAQQLYSNGPLASVPGAGANGADASRLQNILGMTTLGFSAKINGTFINAVADDFTVPAGGWNISRITVFAYQTDSSLASSLIDLRMLIFDGPPDLPTSHVVFGNPAINVLAATSFTNVYRDSQSNPGSSRRPIMSAAANVNASLPAGTTGSSGDSPVHWATVRSCPR